MVVSFADTTKAVHHAEELFTQGAALVDVGAESTPSGATALTADQEWERLKQVLPQLIREHPGAISVDTYYPKTAERAIK